MKVKYYKIIKKKGTQPQQRYRRHNNHKNPSLLGDVITVKEKTNVASICVCSSRGSLLVFAVFVVLTHLGAVSWGCEGEGKAEEKEVEGQSMAGGMEEREGKKEIWERDRKRNGRWV